MSKTPVVLRLPASLEAAAARLAAEDGVPLDQWITSAVAQKVGAVETAAAFLKRRAGGATGERLKDYLATAPAVEPEAEDRF